MGFTKLRSRDAYPAGGAAIFLRGHQRTSAATAERVKMCGGNDGMRGVRTFTAFQGDENSRFSARAAHNVICVPCADVRRRVEKYFCDRECSLFRIIASDASCRTRFLTEKIFSAPCDTPRGAKSSCK